MCPQLPFVLPPSSASSSPFVLPTSSNPLPLLSLSPFHPPSLIQLPLPLYCPHPFLSSIPYSTCQPSSSSMVPYPPLPSVPFIFCLSFPYPPPHTAMYVMFLMRADPLLGQVGRGALEISTFWGPKWLSPNGSMPFHRAQKSLDFQGSTFSHMPSY
jgi:hypothetical protein